MKLRRSPLKKRGGYANEWVREFAKRIADIPHTRNGSRTSTLCQKPEKDFTRKKKLPFETVMQLLISMGGNSIYKELLESQDYKVNYFLFCPTEE